MIAAPVVFPAAQQQVIESFLESPSKSSAFWQSEEASSLRTTIKQHYIGEQKNKCCYCQMENLTDHGRVWDVEHVLPQSDYPQFMFEPLNLAVACIDCNTAKSNKNVLFGKSTVRFPYSSEHYNIIHPHFDKFKDHIRIYFNLVFSPLTEKGIKTIEFCNLLRYSCKFVGQEDAILGNDNINRLAGIVLEAQNQDVRRVALMELGMCLQVKLTRELL